jgi:hypothetical protein
VKTQAAWRKKVATPDSRFGVLSVIRHTTANAATGEAEGTCEVCRSKGTPVLFFDANLPTAVEQAAA